MKKDEMHFYRLIRDFLNEYLINKRNFSEKTARAYRQTLNAMRNYMREEKAVRFENMGFSYFSREYVYDFLLWLKTQKEIPRKP